MLDCANLSAAAGDFYIVDFSLSLHWARPALLSLLYQLLERIVIVIVLVIQLLEKIVIVIVIVLLLLENIVIVTQLLEKIVIVIVTQIVIISMLIQLLEKMQTGRTVNCSPTLGKETLSQGALQLTRFN